MSENGYFDENETRPLSIDDLTDEDVQRALEQYVGKVNVEEAELDAQIADLQRRLAMMPKEGADSAAASEPPKTFEKPAIERIGMSPVQRGAPQCEHLMANNRRCLAPAMARKRYCYFHGESNSGRKTGKRFHVPVLEDHRAIQIAVTKVCQGIADARLDPKTATSLLYGLQVASNAVRRPGQGK